MIEEFTDTDFLMIPDYTSFRDRHYFRVYVIDRYGNKVYHGTRKQAERFINKMKEGRSDVTEKDCQRTIQNRY